MGNRVLKESICTSDTIDQLSWCEEVFFYRLLVNCDDYGRFDARPAVLRSRLFPLKTNITEKAITEQLNKLVTVGLVQMYECDEKPLLQLVTWALHQRVRNSKERYPAPPCRNSPQLAATCGESRQLAARAGANPIQSESNPNPNPNPPISPKVDAARDADFVRFWEAYPRHVAKDKAFTAFKRVAKSEIPALMEALERHKTSAQWTKDDGMFIPHPATWLNQKRWQDELVPAVKRSHGYEEHTFTQEQLDGLLVDLDSADTEGGKS